MDADAPRDAFATFDELDDPRGPSRWRPLDELLLITLLAVICGAQNWADVELFGKSKHKWLATFLKPPHGIASHDTFGRVFAALDPEQWERCFIQWTAALAQAGNGEWVAIDGKTLRRSFDTASEESAIHMISAFASANRVALGQLAVDDKSNEITALPRLLELLDLKGKTVTVDAMHCQRDTARAIRDAEADYLMQVKANQRSLHEDVELFFDEAIAHGWQHTGHAFHETIDKDFSGGGRIEQRRCWSTWDIGWLKRRTQDAPWPDLAGIVCVEAERHLAGKVSRERRYYLTSRDAHDAEALLAAVRGHWAIENSLHGCLDVAFDEDRRCLRQGHAAENFSRICRLATNLLRRDTTTKAGLSARRKRAGWNHDFLLHLIQLA